MNSIRFNIGFIGGGNMSTAIMRGITAQKLVPPSNIWVSGPHLENLKAWTDIGANATKSNREVYLNCQIVFLGVKPNMLDQAVNEIKSHIAEISDTRSKVMIVSMLAGVNIATLLSRVTSITPLSKVIRIMPNTPIAVGAGACLYCVDDNVTNEECQILETLLGGSSMCEKVSESMLESAGALVGCGPAFIYIIIEALADGAVKQGVPRALALRLASQVVIGSGQMVLQSGHHPGLLKDSVCSPGGTTICGVAALEEGNVRSAMIQAIEAASKRSKEMGKK